MDPILNSLNYYYKNCIVDSKENYKFDLEVNRFISARQAFLADFSFCILPWRTCRKVYIVLWPRENEQA